MAVKNDSAPIIIIKKKKKIVVNGHHGGAWKVAYADFVTAMMAFFLLMWLLGSTTESQRMGIADYFSPTVPVFKTSGGGSGAFGSDNAVSQETFTQNESSSSSMLPPEVIDSSGNTGRRRSDNFEAVDGEADVKFTEIESLFLGDSGESTVEDSLLQHIRTRITDEGLIIEIFDLANSRLFVGNTVEPNEKLNLILDMVANVIGIVSNKIAIKGHTDEGMADAGDKFTLSGLRAEFARKRLMDAGIPLERVERLSGNGDSSPSVPDRGLVRNRRIEVILLRDIDPTK